MTPSVIYARVSSKEQEEEGFSIPAQLKLLREYAGKQRFEIVEEFVDVETAKQAGRSNFGQMVHFLKESPSVKAMLVEKTDRLYRNFKDYVTIDELGVEIHLVKEGEVLGPNSRSHQKFIHGIRVLMAKNYIDNLSEEVRKGHAEKAEQGEYPSHAPIGYRNNLQTHTLEVHEQEAAAIKKLFELYASGRYSVRKLRSLAVTAGVVGRRSGRQLSRSEIERILKNPIYYGDFVWKGKYYKGTHPPTITRDLFEAVQKVSRERHRGTRGRGEKFLFTGLFTCSRCSCTITAERKKEKYIYYHCSHAKGKCGQPYVRQEVLEAEVRRLVEDVQVDEERLAWLRESLHRSHADEQAYHNGQLEALNAQYATIQRRLDQAYVDKLDGRIAEDFWQAKSTEWRKEQDAIQDQIARHQRANHHYFEQGLKIFELAQAGLRQYDTKTEEERRNLLAFVLSNCTLNDVTLTPTYRKPFSFFAEGPLFAIWRGRRGSNPRPMA